MQLKLINKFAKRDWPGNWQIEWIETKVNSKTKQFWYWYCTDQIGKFIYEERNRTTK